MNNEEKILHLLTEMKAEMDSMKTEIGSMKAETDKRFDKVDECLQETDKRFDKVDECLQGLDARSLKSAVLLETDVSRDIHLLYEGYSEISKKLDTLATKEQVEELSDDVAVIKEVVSRHSVDIGKLKKAQ